MNYNNFNRVTKTLSSDYSVGTTLDIGQIYTRGNGSLLFVIINGQVAIQGDDYDEFGAEETSSLIQVLKKLTTNTKVVTIVNTGFTEQDTSALKISVTDDSNDYFSQGVSEDGKTPINVTPRVKAILGAGTTEPSQMDGTYVQIKTTGGLALYPRTYSAYAYYDDTNTHLVTTKDDVSNITNVQTVLETIGPKIQKVDEIINNNYNYNPGSEDYHNGESIYMENFVFNDKTPACYIVPNVQSKVLSPIIVNSAQIENTNAVSLASDDGISLASDTSTATNSIHSWNSDDITEFYKDTDGTINETTKNILSSCIDKDGNAVFLHKNGLLSIVNKDTLATTIDKSLQTLFTDITDTTITQYDPEYFVSIIYANSKLIVFTRKCQIAYKEDTSDTWVKVTTNFGSGTWRLGCAYYNTTTKNYGIIQAPSSSTSGYVSYYSIDLSTWTASNSLSGFKGANHAVQYGNYMVANLGDDKNSLQYVYTTNDNVWVLGNVKDWGDSSTESGLSNIVVFKNNLCVFESYYNTTDGAATRVLSTNDITAGFAKNALIPFSTGSYVIANNDILMTCGFSGIYTYSYDGVNFIYNLNKAVSYFTGLSLSQYINNKYFVNICIIGGSHSSAARCYCYRDSNATSNESDSNAESVTIDGSSISGDSYHAIIYPWRSNVFKLDLTSYSSCTFTVDVKSFPEDGKDENQKQVKYGDTLIVSLIIINGNNNTLVFPSNIYWENGVIPTLSRVSLMTLLTYDSGTSWIITPLTNLAQISN